MRVVQGLLVGSRLTVEGHDQEPPGIERGQERGEDPEAEGIAAHRGPRRPGRREDHVLRVIAGEDRNPGERQAADPHQRIGDRDAVPQPAHAAHVLLGAHRVDHRAGTEE